MKKYVLQYGLIGGIIVSIFMSVNMFWLEGSEDMQWGEVIGYAGILIALSSIFFGIRKYRDDRLQGKISFGKAFLCGLYIALIASTLYVLCWMFLSAFFFPDFGTEYFNQQIEQLQNSGLPKAEIQSEKQSMMQMMEYYENPIFKFFITYIEILPLGILISLISAGILRKK